MEGGALARRKVQAIVEVVAPRGGAGAVVAELVVMVVARGHLNLVLAEGGVMLGNRAGIAAGAVEAAGIAGDVLLLVIKTNRQQLVADEADVVNSGRAPAHGTMV